jgi:hypothetical protein
MVPPRMTHATEVQMKMKTMAMILLIMAQIVRSERGTGNVVIHRNCMCGATGPCQNIR